MIPLDGVGDIGGGIGGDIGNFMNIFMDYATGIQTMSQADVMGLIAVLLSICVIGVSIVGMSEQQKALNPRRR